MHVSAPAYFGQVENLEDDPEQFSDATRQGLERALQQLLEGLREHGAQLAASPGGSRSIQAIFAANDAVTKLVKAWAEAVSDHTGTSPVPLRLEEDDEDEWEDDDAPEPVNGDTISVVERWDLVVTDVEALLQAGREAHLRTWENETIDDAVVAVTAPAFALYTLGHEAGPPWLDLPGTELLAGTRLFVRSEETAPDPVESDHEVVEVSQPPGDVLFAETWA